MSNDLDVTYRFEPRPYGVVASTATELRCEPMRDVLEGVGGTIFAIVGRRTVGIYSWFGALAPEEPIPVSVIKGAVEVAGAFRRRGIASEMHRRAVEEHGFVCSEYGVASHVWWDRMSEKYGTRRKERIYASR